MLTDVDYLTYPDSAIISKPDLLTDHVIVYITKNTC